MTNSKSTKRALVSSALAVLMCMAMLIGTTFAWFTDTASTAVNKIQSGNLDIQLLAEDGVTSLEGETLEWQKAAGAENEDILWEPGCTYKLQPIIIKNAGNLALKYKIQITGIDGDAKLNEAIIWTINGVSLDEEKPLLAGEFDTLTIEGHMKEEAGNEYQGLSIDGIGITVVATQYTYENDSKDNTYDENATYPVLAPVLNETTAATKTSDSGDIVITTEKAVSTIPAEAKIKTDASDEQVIAKGGTLTRVLKTTATTTDSVTYDISYSYTENGTTSSVSEFTEVVTNVISLSPGLANVKVTHSHNGIETAMTEAGSENAKADGQFFYNATTGKLTIWSSTYSQFKVSYTGVGYIEAADADAFNDGKVFINAFLQRDAHVVLTDDVVLEKSINLQSSDLQLFLDLNGHKLTVPQIVLSNAATVVISDTVGTGVINFTSRNGIEVSFYGASVVLNGGTLNASSSYAIGKTFEGSVVMLKSADTSFVMNGGKLVADNRQIEKGSMAVWMYGSRTTFIMNSGEIEKNVGTLAAIQASGDGNTVNTKIEINGGSIKSNSVAIYHPQKGSLTVNDGYIEGETAIYAKSGTLAFNGGTMHATADKATDYTYASGSMVATGDAVVIDACGYPGGNPDVTITGGTYTVTAEGAHGFAYYKYNGNTATITNTKGIDIFEQ